jgi:L-fuculose-phosphate aldolase
MTRRHRYRIAERLCEAGRRLDDLGLVPSRDGNLSARIADDRLLVTPTGCRKRELEPSRLVEVDLEGRTVGAGRASTELGLHLAVYRRRPDVESVVHAHPPTAVGFACAGIGLTECLMPESAVHLGSVPLTAYATPGTPALEEAIAPAIEAHDAFLLANHGAVTFGGSVDEALDRMETLEHTARITFTATLLGGPTLLSADALADLAEIRARMGNPRPITCTPRPGTGSPPAPIPEDLVDQVTAAVLAALRDGPKAP